MTRPSLFLLLAACLFHCLPARAHQPAMPATCMDPKAHPKIISTFDLTAQQLEVLRIQQGVHLHKSVADDWDRCGIVDRWLMVDAVTQTYCRVQSPKGLVGAALVTGPREFTSATHHDDYRDEEGAEGSCYVCVPGG